MVRLGWIKIKELCKHFYLPREDSIINTKKYLNLNAKDFNGALNYRPIFLMNRRK